MRKRWLVPAILLVPLIDAFVLAFVAVNYLNVLGTVALVVLTGLVGMLLVRAEGRRTLQKVQESLVRGEPPTDELLDGGLLIAAGAFLLTPGIITDVLGFVLALPVTRIPTRMALKKWVVVPYVDSQTGGFASGNVYVGGFPGGDDEGGSAWGPGTDPGPFGASDGERAGDAGGEVYDLDEDAYDIDVDDVREEDR